jgi:hypothetical protein
MTTMSNQWLLLVHALPAQPAYERVKLHRRLQAIGAVPVKKTVHALPHSEDALEDFQWTAKEIEAAGGEALVCEAKLLSGTSDAHLRQLFDSARDADYRALTQEIRATLPPAARGRNPGKRSEAARRPNAGRLRKRLAEIVALDFFGASGRAAAEAALSELETRIMKSRPNDSTRPAPSARSLKDLRGKTWVTRRNVHVDRMACAWFIGRFIDAKARFKFVEPAGYVPKANELRFDMADGEFTHRGEQCSFEVFLDESGLRDPALRSMAEIVHDLDLKDAKFGRPEVEGVRLLLSGITLSSESDEMRLKRGGTLFDDLYRSFKRNSGKPSEARR